MNSDIINTICLLTGATVWLTIVGVILCAFLVGVSVGVVQACVRARAWVMFRFFITKADLRKLRVVLHEVPLPGNTSFKDIEKWLLQCRKSYKKQ